MNKLARIICLVLISLLAVPIYAKEVNNKLYFTDSEDRLYYDTKLFDDNIFMYHDGMSPGTVYTDHLLIENGSNTDYDLYLKVKEVEQDSDANDLLEHISMEIYLEDELVYNGKVKGLDYNNVGVNIQEAAYIGKYTSKSEKSLVVKTKLDEDYLTNNDKEITSHIEWEFYASYDDKEDDNNQGQIVQVLPITGNPDTGDKISIYIISALSSILLIIILAIFLRKRKN